MRDTIQDTGTDTTAPAGAAPPLPAPFGEPPRTGDDAERFVFSPSESGGHPGSAPARKGLLRRLGPLGLLLLFVFGKLKYVPMLLQVGKFKTFFTMLVSIWAYALFWGWSFAAGFVVLIFIHEMGHVAALRYLGIRATAPMFIPFLGAFIGMKQLPDNAFGEAVAAYGGPLLGTLGAIGCALLGIATGNPFWFALASAGFLLNLFNLLPISPLDGGRIIAVISPKLWILGLAGAMGLFWFTWSPIVALIVIMGSLQIWSAAKRPRDERVRYYTVAPLKRIAMGTAFLALLAVTSVGMLLVQVPLAQFPPGEGMSRRPVPAEPAAMTEPIGR